MTVQRYTFSTHQSQISALEFVPSWCGCFSVTLRGHPVSCQKWFVLLSSQDMASVICISELLSCPSMLCVCCLKCVIEARWLLFLLMLDFLQQIWIMLKLILNWRGYVNNSQMGISVLSSREMQAVYGRSKCLVHHSVIKGHIITYNCAWWQWLTELQPHSHQHKKCASR